MTMQNYGTAASRNPHVAAGGLDKGTSGVKPGSVPASMPHLADAKQGRCGPAPSAPGGFNGGVIPGKV